MVHFMPYTDAILLWVFDELSSLSQLGNGADLWMTDIYTLCPLCPNLFKKKLTENVNSHYKHIFKPKDQVTKSTNQITEVAEQTLMQDKTILHMSYQVHCSFQPPNTQIQGYFHHV